MFVDESKWGRDRLFSAIQWPGLSRLDRDNAVDKTVDLFHEKITSLDPDLNIQWRSNASELRVYGKTKDGDASLVQLEVFLEEAFSEIFLSL